MNAQQPMNSTEDHAEFQFRDLFYALPWVIIPGLLSLLIAGGILFAIFFSLPSYQVFRQSISPTMAQSAPNQYPSGAPFAPDDLRSRLVLEQVYSELKLKSFNISLADFFAAVSVRPFSTTANEILARYRSQLANKKLTFSEREIIEKQLRKELTQRSSDEILISLTTQPQWHVPESVGEAVVAAIPRTWQSVFIKKFGVSEIYDGYARYAPFNADEIGALDTYQGYDSIVRATDQLRALLTSVETANRFNNVRGEDGRTIEDYALELDKIKTDVLNAKVKPALQAGIADDISSAMIFVEARITDLSLQLTENQAIVRSLKSNEGLISGRDDASRMSLQTNGQSSENVSNTINTIIDLVDKSNFATFRQDTLKKLLVAEKKAASISLNIAIEQDFLAALKRQQATAAPSTHETAIAIRKSMQKAAVQTAQLWQKTVTLVDSSSGVDDSGNVQLYRSNSTLRAYQLQRELSLKMVLLIAFGIAVACAATGAAVYTYRLCKRRNII